MCKSSQNELAGICIKLQMNYQESDLNIQAREIDVLDTFEILELERIL